MYKRMNGQPFVGRECPRAVSVVSRHLLGVDGLRRETLRAFAPYKSDIIHA